jgi:hypothetical protein
MTARQFASGREAMDFLIGRSSATPKKSPKQLEAEIDAALAAKPAKSAKSTKARSPRSSSTGTATKMSGDAYLASLPPPLDLQAPEQEKSVSEPELLGRIRKEVNGAITAGALPAGTKLSVTKEHYKSFRIEITAWPGAVFSHKYTEHLLDPKGTPYDRGPYDPREGQDYLSPELNKAIRLISQIAERHNYRAGDPYADYSRYGYFLSVSASTVEAAAQQGLTLESNKEFGDLLERARIAAKAIGPVATKSICGDASLTTAGEDCLKRIIWVAKRAGGKPVKYDKSRRGWFPVETPSHLTRRSSRASSSARSRARR